MKLETDDYIIESEDVTIETISHGYCMEFKIVAYTAKIIQKEVKGKVKLPELYPENLEALQKALRDFEAMDLSGLFGIELRIKIDDVDSWFVIGYGESGDPCILRLEEG